MLDRRSKVLRKMGWMGGEGAFLPAALSLEDRTVLISTPPVRRATEKTPPARAIWAKSMASVVFMVLIGTDG